MSPMKRLLSDAKRRELAVRPQWLLVLAFAQAILAGTALLMLPAANVTGAWLPFIDALFTATSAACVTGLTVIDTGSGFTLFGQLVILTLIQLGGLGVMTLGTFLLVLVGRRLSVRNEFVLMSSFGADEVHGLPSLLWRTLGFTLLFEGIGAAILTSRYLAQGFSLARAIYHGVFHAVSAFCNAGFALYSDSLSGWRHDPLYLLVVMALVVAGGLGFLALDNLSSVRFWRLNRRTRGRVSLHARVILLATGSLLLLGWVAFTALEWNASLGALAWIDKLLCGLFHSVTPRTAGYNVVDMETLSAPAQFLTMALMFVGGSPGSTAGGVKTTTVVVLLLTILAMARGRTETELFHRTIPGAVVREALVIFLLCFLFVGLSFGVILLTENTVAGSAQSFPLLFETVSAFGTVGLSLNLTPSLSVFGRATIILTMFVGRLGPLTVALIVGNRDQGQRLRFPEEEIVVG